MTRWRQSLQQVLQVQQAGRSLPVHWVADNWEFCGGTLPVPIEADDGEALLFNHFEQFFGIRDPLQFKVTVYHGPDEKHFYRVLEPNQSLLLKLSDFFPQRRYAAALAATVEHPALTRGRHYRMRLCGDVFWGHSFTTLHSAHEFNRKPERNEEFRLSAGLVREGEIALTVPNFDRNQVAGSIIETSDGVRLDRQDRDLAAYLQEVRLTPAAGAEGGFVSCRYQGYGGSFWFAFDRQAKTGGSLSGNHHISVPWTDRRDMPQSAEEAARINQLSKAGYIIDPHPVPVLEAANRLRFGFDCDSANPPCTHFHLHLFDAAGKVLTRLPYAKAHAGPSFPEHFLAGVEPAIAAATRLAIVSPDWLKNGQTRAGYKLLPDLVIEDRLTGDRDVTEFQSCWRNLGVAIEGFPHWLSPANGIIGRSNLVGRVRHGDGYLSGLALVNGSGSLRYDRPARIKIVVSHLAGATREAMLTLPAFCSRLVWLQDLLPDLGDFLEGQVGGLMVKSADADINCQLVTTNAHGAVALQHLWGY
ncbi:MAG TPA: hypothetical protein VND94_03510 [Terriglobia bacterium]|nr:hypothetical protein [Terriglobia bacterium]